MRAPFFVTSPGQRGAISGLGLRAALAALCAAALLHVAPIDAAPPSTPAPKPCCVVDESIFYVPIVYFDWNSAVLSEAGRRDIVRQVAYQVDWAKGVRAEIAEMRIQGFADTSGPEEASLDIAYRRAAAVRGALKAAGLLPRSSTILVYGEQHPLKETPDGVREHLNRRVEVQIRLATPLRVETPRS